MGATYGAEYGRTGAWREDKGAPRAERAKISQFRSGSIGLNGTEIGHFGLDRTEPDSGATKYKVTFCYCFEGI